MSIANALQRRFKARGTSIERFGSPPYLTSIQQGPAGLKKAEERERGFTLVELMVVIVIIGLLATIVALNVLPSGDKARVEKAKADISQIEGALELYKLQNLNFPTTSQGLAALSAAPAGLADPSRYQKGGYLKKLPDDPWGRPYLYASPGQHGDADVWSYGADGKEGGEGIDADIGSWQ